MRDLGNCFCFFTPFPFPQSRGHHGFPLEDVLDALVDVGDVFVGLCELGLILNVSVAMVDVLAIGSLLVDLCAMLVHPRAHQHAQALLHRLLVELGVGGNHSRRWQGG